jgi:hypothetical protein
MGNDFARVDAAASIELVEFSQMQKGDGNTYLRIA